MASIEMVQIDYSWIFSPVTPDPRSKLSSLNATLNSPAEGPVLSSAQAPTIEDLNQLNTKLMEVQLSSTEESKNDGLAAYNARGERHGFVQNSSVSNPSSFRHDGGNLILLDFTDAIDLSTYFQLSDDTSADEANKIHSPTVDGEVHSSGDAVDNFVPELHRDGEEPMLIDLSNMAFQSFEDTSSNKAQNMSSSTVGRDQCVCEKAGWEAFWEAAIPYEPRCNGHIPVSDLPLLQQGVPTPLEIPLDCDASFRPFRDTSSDDANQTSPTTVDEKTHGSRDDEADKDLPAFQRSGWDAMGGKPTDLARYMHYDTSNNAAPMKIKSRL